MGKGGLTMPFQKTPYPYCPHGVYVGGCGADYLCGACEDGEPLTEQERADYKQAKEEWNNASGEDQFWSLPAHVLDGP